jgi:hypothetical protein
MAMKNIGVLWKKQGKDGKPSFLSGILDNGIHGEISIMVFPNDKKGENGKGPDYRLVMVKDDAPRQTSTQQSDDFMGDPGIQEEPMGDDMQF